MHWILFSLITMVSCVLTYNAVAKVARQDDNFLAYCRMAVACAIVAAMLIWLSGLERVAHPAIYGVNMVFVYFSFAISTLFLVIAEIGIHKERIIDAIMLPLCRSWLDAKGYGVYEKKSGRQVKLPRKPGTVPPSPPTPQGFEWQMRLARQPVNNGTKHN